MELNLKPLQKVRMYKKLPKAKQTNKHPKFIKFEIELLLKLTNNLFRIVCSDYGR